MFLERYTEGTRLVGGDGDVPGRELSHEETLEEPPSICGANFGNNIESLYKVERYSYQVDAD